MPAVQVVVGVHLLPGLSRGRQPGVELEPLPERGDRVAGEQGEPVDVPGHPPRQSSGGVHAHREVRVVQRGGHRPRIGSPSTGVDGGSSSGTSEVARNAGSYPRLTMTAVCPLALTDGRGPAPAPEQSSCDRPSAKASRAGVRSALSWRPVRRSPTDDICDHGRCGVFAGQRPAAIDNPPNHHAWPVPGLLVRPLLPALGSLRTTPAGRHTGSNAQHGAEADGTCAETDAMPPRSNNLPSSRVPGSSVPSLPRRGCAVHTADDRHPPARGRR